MKIVHVTSYLDKSAAGVRQVILDLARSQIKKGDEVYIVGLSNNEFINDNIDWFGIKTFALKVYGPLRIGYSPDMADLLVKLDPDIVHLHGLWMHPTRSVLLWHRKTSKNFIISPHGMLSPVSLSYSRLKKKLVSCLFQDKAFKLAAALHVTSDGEYLDAKKYTFNKRIEVIANGVSYLDLPSRSNSKSFSVLSLGRIHDQKGLDLLIHAWAKIESLYPTWVLNIVGPGEKQIIDKLNDIIENYNLKNVVISGPVYNEDKITLMRNADLFVLPSHSENFALTVLESLMLEVPVISSTGAPWSRLENEGCGLWVSNEPTILASALSTLMKLDDNTRRQMGKRGRLWVIKEFSWDVISDKMVVMYQKYMS